MLLRDKILAAVAVMLLAVGYCHDARAEGLPKASLVPIGEIAKSGSWTGFNAYGAVGYGWTKSDFDAVSSGDPNSINANAAMLTGGVGYDVQLSSFVFGLMADVSWSNLDAAWKAKDALQANGEWFVGARAGILPTTHTLVYGLFGYTEKIDGHLSFTSAATTDLGNLAGLTYGGGIEHIFAAGWAVRAEYRFVQLGHDTAPMGKIDGIADGTTIDTGEHQFRLGVVYHFNSK